MGIGGDFKIGARATDGFRRQEGFTLIRNYIIISNYRSGLLSLLRVGRNCTLFGCIGFNFFFFSCIVSDTPNRRRIPSGRGYKPERSGFFFIGRSGTGLQEVPGRCQQSRVPFRPRIGSFQVTSGPIPPPEGNGKRDKASKPPTIRISRGYGHSLLPPRTRRE